MSINRGNKFKLAIGAALFVLLLFIASAVFTDATAASLDEPLLLIWDNPTTRADGSPIVGQISTRLHFSQTRGGSDVRVAAEPSENQLTIVPRDIGLTAGDWFVHAVSMEEGNPAGPSTASESAGPFVVVGDPSPPNPATNLRLQQ